MFCEGLLEEIELGDGEELALHEVLVLNSNYEPLNVCNIRRAMALLLLGKAEVVHHRERRRNRPLGAQNAISGPKADATVEAFPALDPRT